MKNPTLPSGTSAADQDQLVPVEEHLIQMCLDRSHRDEGGPRFGEWLLFDDLWASAHPELADALLAWCARWDVLTGR